MDTSPHSLHARLLAILPPCTPDHPYLFVYPYLEMHRHKRLVSDHNLYSILDPERSE